MDATDPRRARTAYVAVGAVGGLAWTAALRGVMSELAGVSSSVHWVGTFGFILLPGVVAGALVGWALWRKRAGLVRGWIWLALAPLVFAGDPVALPLPASIIGLAFACSGRGRRWARWLAGVPSALLLVAVPLAVGFAVRDLPLTSPRGAWVALLIASLFGVAVIAELLVMRPAVRAAAVSEAGR